MIPPAVSNSDTFQNLVGFPSGQREQTVNLPSQTSKVRILPPPTIKNKLLFLNIQTKLRMHIPRLEEG